jgi:sodium/potassium-transporting ATPase subunit alpha
VARSAADIILRDDNFANIVHGIKAGRVLFDNLKKQITFSLISNIPEMAPFIVYLLFQIPLPYTPLLTLVVDLGTNFFPSVAFAGEPEEDNIMLRKPRNVHGQRLINKKLVSFTYLQLGVIQVRIVRGLVCSLD